ncbi:YdeI/OmpD-associated family protein [Nocardia cyriacigeorgica]|uniref:YdeI/OmpD-associated family protein n=1 Tax=Nocardia cyriacigeorgica TaxID=135487 RepID=UPI002457A4F3|nr:YdeI/OmpD-associated family protein [Nocardia cyriacigeorgica]
MAEFRARIQSAVGGGAYVAVPEEIIAELGGGGRIPVRARFDDVDYIGSIVSMGAGPCLGMLKAIRAELGKEPGDLVTVTVERDTSERTVEVPEDLAAALDTAGLRTRFDELPYSRRRDAVRRVTEAKREQTRINRIEAIVGELS